MTYHMERVKSRKFTGAETGRITFPHKLWDALNEDCGLLRWSRDGRSFLVREDRFENQVMRLHPGLVQITTFANFRRQLRWYCFDWNCLNDLGDFEFSHPNFIRGNDDMLEGVLTRRRSVIFPKKMCSPSWETGEDSDSPGPGRGGSACRMTLRDKVPAKNYQPEPSVSQYRKKRKRKSTDMGSSEIEDDFSLLHSTRFADEGLWWYYCAIFGPPEHTFSNIGDEKKPDEVKAKIPVCFNEDPVPAEVFSCVDEENGAYGLDGRNKLMDAKDVDKIWECVDVRMYSVL